MMSLVRPSGLLGLGMLLPSAACVRIDQVHAGHHAISVLIAQAIDHQERQGERWCRSELQRVDASVMFHAGEPLRAEKRLQQALAEARAIGALTFELRIATDLAEHWIASGRTPKSCPIARPGLSKIHRGL
jgi:predicted ATPase